MGEVMIPRVCQVKHAPPASYGDCIRACIATIIDRDDVPHVFDGRSGEEAWSALRQYLKELKRCLFVINVEENPFQFMGTNNPDIPYMLLCSAGGADHAVVCVGSDVFHDPAWYKSLITGPTSQGFYIIAIVGVLP